MYRADSAGVAVVRHARGLAQPRLVELCVGKEDAKCRVADEFFLRRVELLHQHPLGIQKHLAVVGAQAGDLAACLKVVNVAHRVDRDERTDLQVAHLHGVAADAGFHAVVHAQQLADSRTCARAVVAVAVVAGLGVDAGRVGHGCIGPGAGVGHGQIEQVGLADEGHFCHTYVKTNAAFLEIPHDAACGIQPEGAAARQHNGVDDLRRRQRLEQLALPRGRPAAAHIQSRRGAILAQQHHCAARARRRVFRLTDLEVVKGCNGDFFHGSVLSAMPLYRIIIDHCTPHAPPAQQKIPPGAKPGRDGRSGVIQTRGHRIFPSIF